MSSLKWTHHWTLCRPLYTVNSALSLLDLALLSPGMWPHLCLGSETRGVRVPGLSLASPATPNLLCSMGGKYPPFSQEMGGLQWRHQEPQIRQTGNSLYSRALLALLHYCVHHYGHHSVTSILWQSLLVRYPFSANTPWLSLPNLCTLLP